MLVSCRKEIKFTGEMTEPKLVVNCLLEAGNTIEVFVSRSAPVTGNTEPIVLSGAVVELFENSSSIGLGEETEQGTYFFDHEVLEGRTYRLEVEYSGLKSVNSETKVPSPTSGFVASITPDSPPLNVDFEGYTNQLDFVIQDASADQFYLFYLIQYYQGQESSIPFYSIEPILERQSDLYYDGGLFSDASFNGTNYTLDINIIPYENDLETQYYAVLRSLNQDLFRYMQSTRTDNDGFLTEPAQIYSNIENGIGIFAASSEFEVELP